MSAHCDGMVSITSTFCPAENVINTFPSVLDIIPTNAQHVQQVQQQMHLVRLLPLCDSSKPQRIEKGDISESVRSQKALITRQ